MKKNIIISIGLLLSGFSYSQVGINTTNPQGIFNIDGRKDNPPTGSGHTNLEQLNDFTVTAAGNVGIGKIAPSTKLHITTGGTAKTPNPSGFRLEDGNQKSGYILTSNADGVGTWKPAEKITYQLGTNMPNNFVNIPFVRKGEDDWYSTGSYITLAPGVWSVEINQLLAGFGNNNNNYPLADEWMWFRFSFTDDASWGANPIRAANGHTPLDPNRTSRPRTALTADFITLDTSGTVISSGTQYVSTNYDGPTVDWVTRFAVANGTFLIRNNTSAPKTYYLCANPYDTKTVIGGRPNFYFRNVGSNWAENRIIATSINLTK